MPRSSPAPSPGGFISQMWVNSGHCSKLPGQTPNFPQWMPRTKFETGVGTAFEFFFWDNLWLARKYHHLARKKRVCFFFFLNLRDRGIKSSPFFFFKQEICLLVLETTGLKIKQLPFCFTASRFSATPSPAEPQTAQWVDFAEQMSNCGLICFFGEKKRSWSNW